MNYFDYLGQRARGRVRALNRIPGRVPPATRAFYCISPGRGPAATDISIFVFFSPTEGGKLLHATIFIHVIVSRKLLDMDKSCPDRRSIYVGFRHPASRLHTHGTGGYFQPGMT